MYKRQFLRSQPEQARNIFIRRYWYCDATADIAKRYGIGESKVRVTPVSYTHLDVYKRQTIKLPTARQPGFSFWVKLF